MKNKKIPVLTVSILIIINIILLVKPMLDSHITEVEAIKILQESYKELKSYPSDLLPPKTIQTKKTKKWQYVAFVQLWSGVPYIEARCFFVDNQKRIHSLGLFKPQSIGEKFYIDKCIQN